MEITAIIPARGGSVRIARKNLLPLAGESLLGRKIRQLAQCRLIDRIVVGSEDDEILGEAQRCGAETVRRPERFCDEKVCSANDMIANLCDLVPTDIVVWCHCTNPLISATTYQRAIESFLADRICHDSLLSVAEFREHLWQDGKPLNYNPYAAQHIPARDLEPLYAQDGGIFIQPHAQMLHNRYFFGSSPQLYVIPDDEYLDINDWRDYLLAQALTAAVNAAGGGRKQSVPHSLVRSAASGICLGHRYPSLRIIRHRTPHDSGDVCRIHTHVCLRIAPTNSRIGHVRIRSCPSALAA